MRIKNLIVLVVGVAVILVLNFVALPWALKLGIEAGGTAIVGAKVDVQKVGVGFHTLSLDIRGLEVTDKNNTMRNALEVARIAFKMHPLAALEGKAVIEEVEVRNVRLGTPRKSDGYVKPAKPKKAKTEEEKALEKEAIKQNAKDAVGALAIAAEVPTKEDIEKYTKGDLKSVQFAEYVASNSGYIGEKWTKFFEDVDYGMRAANAVDSIAAIDSAIDVSSARNAERDIKRKTQTLTKALKEINAISTEIAEKKRELDADFATLNADLAAIPEVAKEELRDLYETLKIAPLTVDTVADAVFGPSVMPMVRQGLYWFDMARTMMSKPKKSESLPKVKQIGSKGYDVAFPLERAYPSFHLVKAHASYSGDTGAEERFPVVEGNVNDITSDQNVVGRTTKADLHFTIPSFGDFDARIAADFDRRGNAERDTYSITAMHMPVKDIDFGQGGNGLPSAIRSATAHAAGSVLIDTDRLEIVLGANFESIVMAYNEDEQLSEVYQIIKDIFLGINRLKLDVSYRVVDGKASFKITSDIDRTLAASIQRVLGAKFDEARGRVEAQVNERLSVAKGNAEAAYTQERAKALERYNAQMEQVTAARAAIEEKSAEAQGKIDAAAAETTEAIDKAKEDYERTKNEAEAAAQEEVARKKAEAEAKFKEEEARFKAEQERIAAELAAKKAEEEAKAKAQLEEEAQKAAEELRNKLRRSQ